MTDFVEFEHPGYHRGSIHVSRDKVNSVQAGSINLTPSGEMMNVIDCTRIGVPGESIAVKESVDEVLEKLSESDA